MFLQKAFKIDETQASKELSLQYWNGPEMHRLESFCGQVKCDQE
jgi:hypothetical protein